LNFNNIIFTRYDDQIKLQPFFAYISDIRNQFCGNIDHNYIVKKLPLVTDVFVAYVKHDKDEGRFPIAYALFIPDKYHQDTMYLHVVCSRSIRTRSAQGKARDIFMHEWRDEVELEDANLDDPETAFAAQGKDYALYKHESRRIRTFNNERKILQTGLGVILLSEAIKHFSSSTTYKHMRLEPARPNLIPYYERFGFKVIPREIVGDPYNMMLDDMSGEGQRKAEEWARNYFTREFDLEFWDAIRNSVAWKEEEGTYVGKSICANCMLRPATVECGADGCGGEGAMYCGHDCQKQDWIEGGHVLVCGNVSKSKAKRIRGHELTEAQRRFFGWLSTK